MSKHEIKLCKIDLDAELVEEIENFLQEYPEANYGNVTDFIKNATVLHMQELKKKYTRVQLDALVFLKELVTKDHGAHR
jgi:hypothetical protein